MGFRSQVQEPACHCTKTKKENIICFVFYFFKRGGEKGRRGRMNFTETAHMFSTANVTFWKTAGGHLLRRFTVRQNNKTSTLKRVHAENNGDVFLNTFFTGIACCCCCEGNNNALCSRLILIFLTVNKREKQRKKISFKKNKNILSFFQCAQKHNKVERHLIGKYSTT